jgi:hypothetical protein
MTALDKQNSRKGAISMPKPFCVYSLKPGQKDADYDRFLSRTKIPRIPGGTLVHRV